MNHIAKVKEGARKRLPAATEGGVGAAAAVVSLLSLSQPVAAAGNLQGTQLYTGTIAIINDITTILLVVGPIVAAACILFFFIRLQAADEMDQKKWQNRIKIAIIACIGVVATVATLKAIIAYFA